LETIVEQCKRAEYTMWETMGRQLKIARFARSPRHVHLLWLALLHTCVVDWNNRPAVWNTGRQRGCAYMGHWRDGRDENAQAGIASASLAELRRLRERGDFVQECRYAARL